MTTTVEIKSINTDLMCLIVRCLREAGMKNLAEIFMLWSFDVEWDDIPDLADGQINLVKAILNKCCNSCEIRVGDIEIVVATTAESEDEEECADLLEK